MTTEVGTLVFKTETSGIVKAEKELARAEKEAAKLEKAQQRAAAQAVKLSNAKYKAAAAAGKAAKSYNAVVAELIKADIEAKKTAQAVTILGSATEKVERQMDKVEAAAMKGRGGFRAMRGSTAQLGMQIQDMAVQAQMGTNSLIILGQQGPQIASLFGPAGAIVGAFVAVGAAVANMALGFGKAKDEGEKLAKAMDAVDLAFERTEQGAYGLSQRIKELADRSEELARVELALGISKARIQLKEAEKQMVRSFDEIMERAEVAAQQFEKFRDAAEHVRNTELEFGGVREELDSLTEKFGLTREQALSLAIAFNRFEENQSEENFKGLSDVVRGLATATQTSNPLLAEFFRTFLDADVAARDAAEILKLFNEQTEITGSTTEASTKAINDSIEALELRAATVGMTARQEALYRIELSKASDFEKAVMKERVETAFDAIDAKTEELKATKAAIKLANQEGALRAQFAANDIKRLEQQNAAREKETSARDRALQAAYEYAQGIIAMNDTEQEAFDRMITEKRNKLEADHAAGLILEAEYQAAKTALDKAEELKRADNQKKIAAERTKALLAMEDVFMSGKSDRAKAAYRLGVNLMNKEKRDNAERIISESYVAAMKAYSSLAKIDIVGPVLGAAAAAAVIATGATYAAGALSGRALGGQVRPGESYVVGERGPEILTMGNAGGRVTPNSAITNKSRLTYAPTVNISGGATDQDRAMFMAELRRQKAEIADLMMRRRF
jgi:hypothetical protein